MYSSDFKIKYKTELCKNWLNGFCLFENKCAFAHGRNELRNKIATKSEEIEEILPSQVFTKKRLPVFVELSKRLSKENN